ncbi:hypothetical protein RO3G_11934 [Rhizopus delemar RA 99-880]|uniref:Mitochondrial import inner membrane translocase subunit Tim21 n=1 Tax=Rhizopus delemar (strain RA 99-880 / ATCC MYA-4621 / FGSC 9543 / NRRL 43880) TaxID=246409 RepID=I1CFJ3_RHIO9|nr:hypothetical protein RO3G_11934 [Rhizopus delemar RA 99-880]|eukprot:EIE87223.1 hypothetical protein RO3G_11934 [Rhizopus delemar RA 99-880]
MLRILGKRSVGLLPKTNKLSSRNFSAPVQYRKSNQTSSISAAKPWSVILAGVTLTSAVVYYIGSELFGSQSTTNIFSDAVDRIRASEEIVNVVGEPIKAHGEPR